LQWYVTEQIEEEGNDNEIIAKLKLVGEDGNGLLMVDKELAMRVFTPPAASDEG
jgi:ferritin